jgi:hypothetical protein
MTPAVAAAADNNRRTGEKERIRGFMAFAGFPGIPHQASLHGEHIHVPLCEEFFMITSLRISAFAGQDSKVARQ